MRREVSGTRLSHPNDKRNVAVSLVRQPQRGLASMNASGLYARLLFLISHIKLKIDESKGNSITGFEVRLPQLLARRRESASRTSGDWAENDCKASVIPGARIALTTPTCL